MQYVRQVTGEFEDICVYKIVPDSVSSYEFARNLGTYEPEAIFIEIADSDTTPASRLIRDLYSHSPQTAVIGVAKTDTPTIREAAHACGVGTLLTLPFSAEQLQQALLDAMLPKNGAGTGLLAVMLPARPGSGATVIGWNAAHALATLFRKRVLFMDTDYYGSVVDEMLLPAGSSKHTGTLLPSLNDLSWPRIALKIAPNLDVVPTSVVRELVGFSRWELNRLVQIAKTRYDFVVMRVARTSDPHVGIALRRADRVCLVTSADAASCNGAARRCKELRAVGVPDKQIQAVVNRQDAPPSKGLQGIPEFRIAGAVPDGRRAVHDAFEHFLGVMPQGSAFTKGIASLCESLWGVTQSDSGWTWWKSGRKTG